jgi:hypothetical protein
MVGIGIGRRARAGVVPNPPVVAVTVGKGAIANIAVGPLAKHVLLGAEVSLGWRPGWAVGVLRPRVQVGGLELGEGVEREVVRHPRDRVLGGIDGHGVDGLPLPAGHGGDNETAWVDVTQGLGVVAEHQGNGCAELGAGGADLVGLTDGAGDWRGRWRDGDRCCLP